MLTQFYTTNWTLESQKVCFEAADMTQYEEVTSLIVEETNLEVLWEVWLLRKMDFRTIKVIQRIKSAQ